MSKVFTITEGLENMGAMKTGGQGSVYKGRRVGEIVTAIKLLPTPIINPSEDDRSYRDFMNEVQKLKRVNEEPHPNVVTILSSGVSDTGNFPFIEMEYIEGPDLEDLTKPPHDPVFCIKDVCKVAEHLSNALAHCHKYGVKHGDIKSNNVKFNVNTGNYVLLDFGLSVMSDEQRRTSLRNAGAIEFMAPEQNEGQILFATDVYSFGVILFELLAGRVPFPLNDRTESARNTVRLSHIESQVPDILDLRMRNMPADWPEEKKERELHVPGWLLDTVYKCLQKNPQDRFEDGVLLHDHILHQRNASSKQDEELASQLVVLKKINRQLTDEVSSLKQRVNQYEQNATTTTPLQTAGAGVAAYDSDAYIAPTRSGGVSRTTFIVVLLLAVTFAAIAAYSYFGKGSTNQVQSTFAAGSDSTDTTEGDVALLNEEVPATNQPQQTVVTTDEDNIAERVPEAKPITNRDTTKQQVTDTTRKQEAKEDATPPEQEKPSGVGARYRISSKAYFHTKADESTRTNDYIIPSANVVLRALEDKGDFILVRFIDNEGGTTTGWLNKKDLSKAN